MNMIIKLIEYLNNTHWILFSIIMFGCLIISFAIISIGCKMESGSIGKSITILAGVFIFGSTIILYIDRYIESFKIIAKWSGIGLLIIFGIVGAAIIVSFICERDVNSRLRSKCNANIVYILSIPKYKDKIIEVGSKLAAKGNIVLYPNYINNGIDDTLENNKIKLSNCVVVVADHCDTSNFIFDRKIGYANDLNKKIIYDIGNRKNIDDNIIRFAMNTDNNNLEKTLSYQDYDHDTVEKIISISRAIKRLATVDELTDFLSRKLDLEYFYDKYDL